MPVMDVLGGKSKHLIDIINDLEQFGIQKSQIPLPKIVVVGDQSAGKSSIVEALSGIKVPRASQTCTRVGQSKVIFLCSTLTQLVVPDPNYHDQRR